MFKYTPMEKGAMTNKTLLKCIIIASLFGIAFWVSFVFIHPIFFLFAIVTNAIQFLLLIERNHRKKLNIKKEIKYEITF